MESGMPSHPAEQTGTLPVTGTGSIPVSGDGAAAADRPDWLEAARAGLTEPGRFLAFEDPNGGEQVVELTREWTRVGRSLTADVRFDDATVSRRHALVVVEGDGVRVLDDRSLNGIRVNQQRVGEWSPLRDGDELGIGRHRLFFIDTVAVPAAQPS